MDPLEIEDTSNWLGCPTELETCRHYLRMLENEVQELTLQLRKAREDIFGLVQMHAEASRELDDARKKLRERSGELSTLRTAERDLQIITRGKDRLIEDLRRQLHDKDST